MWWLPAIVLIPFVLIEFILRLVLLIFIICSIIGLLAIADATDDWAEVILTPVTGQILREMVKR